MTVNVRVTAVPTVVVPKLTDAASLSSAPSTRTLISGAAVAVEAGSVPRSVYWPALP